MRYAIQMLTDYGEEWNASVRRDPDNEVRTFSVRITDESGRIWEGVLTPAPTPLPPAAAGRIVRATVADKLPWMSQG